MKNHNVITISFNSLISYLSFNWIRWNGIHFLCNMIICKIEYFLLFSVEFMRQKKGKTGNNCEQCCGRKCAAEE